MSVQPANFGVGDVAYGVMSAIFGSNWANMFTEGPTSSIAPLLTDIFFTFNSAVATTMALIVGYILWAGVQQSAHEGQVMGKRWNSFWIPVRLIFAGALATPIPTFGFSFIQMLVLFVAGTSFDVANDVASRVATHLSSGSQLVNADIIQPREDSQVISALLMSETCMAYHNKSVQEMGGAAGSGDIERSWSGLYSAYSSVAKSLDFVPDSAAIQKLSYGGGGVFGVGGESCGDLSVLYGGEYFPILRDGIDLASTHLRAAAEQIVNNENPSPDLYTKALSALRDARQKMTDKVKGDAKNKDLLAKMASDIESGGFIKLGLYYVRILQSHSQVNQASTFEAGYEFPEADDEDKALGGMSEYMVKAAAYVQKTAGDSGITNPNAAADSSDKTGAFFVGITTGIMKILNADGDAYTKMISLGHELLSYSLPVYTGERLINGVANAIPLVGDGAAKIVGAVMAPVHWVAAACIVIGGWCAWYLPMIPFISWVIGIFGIFVSIIQSLFAAQIWAASHALPEGEGIAGAKAQQGYMLLINLALRPILVTMGFIFSFYLLWAGSYLVIEGLGSYIGSLQEMSGSVTVSLIGVAVTVAAAAVMISIIATMSFGFIFSLADDVLAWVGEKVQLGSAQLAEKAQRFFGMVTSGRGKTGSAARIPGGKAGKPSGGAGAPAGGGAIKIKAGKF